MTSSGIGVGRGVGRGIGWGIVGPRKMLGVIPLEYIQSLLRVSPKLLDTILSAVKHLVYSQ